MFIFRLYQEMKKLIVEVSSLIKELKLLAKLIRLRKPGMVFLKIVGEGHGMLQFKLVLPAPGASDVVNREVSVKIGENDPIQVNLPGDAVESEIFECPDETEVTGTLVDIDDASPTPNRSEPRDFSFIVVDTIAPPQPGEIGIAVVNEI